jgi:hypothetical protein
MATAHGTHLLSGHLLNYIFKVRDGKQVVSLAPFKSDYERRLRERDKCPTYFQNLAEFTAANKIGCQLYNNLDCHAWNPGAPVLMPYAHNRLISAVKKSVHRDNHPKGGIGSAFRIQEAYHALKGLDLSHPDAPSSAVKFQPLGPQYNPLSIKIEGLRHAAEAITRHGNATVEFQIDIRQSRYQELVQHPEDRSWITLQQAQGEPESDDNESQYHSKPTGWLPIDIVPEEGITIPLPKRPESERYITTVVIQWRELRTVGRRIRLHRTKAIVKIVSVHAPASALNLRIPHPGQNPYNIKPIAPVKVPDPNAWRKDPEAYLKAALNNLIA